jgi:UDP-N-acetyl-D-galactosamine dehydrogenase
MNRSFVPPPAAEGGADSRTLSPTGATLPSAARHERIAVIGLGYVGLPVAAACARAGWPVVGFDVSASRVAALRKGEDATGEVAAAALRQPTLQVTDDAAVLADATFFIVTVPTPVDAEQRPDLTPLAAACATVGKHLKRGAVVVFESTVYPGVTEEFCGPLLADRSGLVCGQDFALGYSPERINPGDREHALDKIVKVVAGQDAATLARVAAVYATVATAGVYRAPSIRVAEAAKVMENIQRDLNIALMNELALICDRLGLSTREVLAAAGTKWNFLKFTPGLVGGHCIGVDPYYLTAKAESVGYHPQVILSGRRINDGMGRFVAQKAVKLLAEGNRLSNTARVGVLGLTFKENVPDLRNSRVIDIIAELQSFGISPLVHDALATREAAAKEYGVTLSPLATFTDIDALILAVPHDAYRQARSELLRMLAPGGVLLDVKGMLEPREIPAGIRYWSL